jgi:hypothetical protein
MLNKEQTQLLLSKYWAETGLDDMKKKLCLYAVTPRKGDFDGAPNH